LQQSTNATERVNIISIGRLPRVNVNLPIRPTFKLTFAIASAPTRTLRWTHTGVTPSCRIPTRLFKKVINNIFVTIQILNCNKLINNHFFLIVEYTKNLVINIFEI